MDHAYAHDERVSSVLTSSGAFQGANNAQQSFRRLVRRGAQLPRAQVRAGRVRGRAGGALSRFQSAAGAFQRRRRRNGKSQTVTSDPDGYGNEVASADVASRKGGAGVEEAIAGNERRDFCFEVNVVCKACFSVRSATCLYPPNSWLPPVKKPRCILFMPIVISTS